MTTETRLVPFDADAENEVIASAMFSRRALDSLAFLQPSHFMREQNAWAWSAIRDVASRGEAPTVWAVESELAKVPGRLEECGGREWLEHIRRTTLGVDDSAEFYGRIVEKLAHRRRLISITSGFMDALYDVDRDAPELASDFIERLLREGIGHSRPITRSAREILGDSDVDPDVGLMRDIEEMIERPEIVRGLSTGWEELDVILDGLQPARLVVVLASPNVGKSFFGHSVAWTNLNAGHAVHLVTTEMSTKEAMQRLVFMEAAVDPLRWRQRGHTTEEVRRVRVAAADALHWPLYVTNLPSMPVTTLHTEIRRVQAQHATKVVIIDHLQDVTVPGMRRGSPDEINAAASGCHDIAVNTYLPVVLICHVNREAAKGGYLDMHSGHGGGNIERYANQMISLMPAKRNGTGWAPIVDPAELERAKGQSRIPILAKSDKQRAGGSGYDVRYLDWGKGGRFERMGEDR